MKVPRMLFRTRNYETHVVKDPRMLWRAELGDGKTGQYCDLERTPYLTCHGGGSQIR